MTTTRSVETKIADTAEKITRGLGDYFKKNVLASCKKVRDNDESWFDEMLSGLVGEFQTSCSEKVNQVLKDFAVAEKGELIAHANTHLQVSKPWAPSGDPAKDVRAQLLVHDLEHAKKISQTVVDLHRQLRPKVAELRAKRRQIQDEYTQLQLMARQLEELRQDGQFLDKYCLTPTDTPSTNSEQTKVNE